MSQTSGEAGQQLLSEAGNSWLEHLEIFGFFFGEGAAFIDHHMLAPNYQHYSNIRVPAF